MSKDRKTKMRILISGSQGMVGSAVKEVFKNDDLILTDIGNMNVANYENVMSYEKEKPHLIIHLAAETNLESCEKNIIYAYMVNHTGTVNVMILAKKLDIPIVFISTAGIFDGKRGAYIETSIPNPINHYGRSKWFAEMSLKNYPKVWTFRASWMMGGGPDIDKKFVNLIYQQIKAGRKEIYALCDVYGSPTYTIDLARTIDNVIEQRAPYGTYNCGGEVCASRYTVAKAIVEFLKVDVKVIPVNEDFFRKDFACPRSKNETLVNDALNQKGLSKMRDWKVALKEYIEKCYTL